MSSLRLKVILASFVTVLLLVMCGLMLLLVSRIFREIFPTIRADLEWKTERGAVELAQSAELGIILRDRDLIVRTFRPFQANPDVVAIAAAAPSGEMLASVGVAQDSWQALFAGPPNVLHANEQQLWCWAESTVEGTVVGRVAIVVTKARLLAGQRLQRDIATVTVVGSIVWLLVSLFFVTFYIGPLVKVTERAFESLKRSQQQMAAKERLEKELEIGARIQTSILPRHVELSGLEVAASMLPATEVGGDYYDLIPAEDGGWIAIGDVTGHGLTSGLVMLMTQSAIATLGRDHRDRPPRDLLKVLNSVLFDNIRHRLGIDDHVTLSLLRYYRDGRVLFAGAHEEMIVFRAATGLSELIDTPGTWFGARANIDEVTVDSSLELHDGDVLVLYTDGVIEAISAGGELFGIQRLRAAVERLGTETSAQIHDAVLGEVSRWSAHQMDDVTLIVLRYRALPLQRLG